MNFWGPAQLMSCLKRWILILVSCLVMLPIWHHERSGIIGYGEGLRLRL